MAERRMTKTEIAGNALGIGALVALPFIIGGVIYLSKKAQLGGEIMRGRGFGRGIRQAREERGKGIPLNDLQRAARHYGVTEDEVLRNPEKYPLPPRGTGL